LITSRNEKLGMHTVIFVCIPRYLERKFILINAISVTSFGKI
jgi:hypothetical protein